MVECLGLTPKTKDDIISILQSRIEQNRLEVEAWEKEIYHLQNNPATVDAYLELVKLNLSTPQLGTESYRRWLKRCIKIEKRIQDAMRSTEGAVATIFNFHFNASDTKYERRHTKTRLLSNEPTH